MNDAIITTRRMEYDDAYPTCAKTYAELRIYTSQLPPQVVPEALRLTPTTLLVLGRYVAVTSIDSGEFVPTEKEAEAGGQSHEKIAYSPTIQDAGHLPREGWDECYIFGSPTELGVSHVQENIFEAPRERGHLNVLVGYYLALHKPEMESMVTLFWQQMTGFARNLTWRIPLT